MRVIGWVGALGASEVRADVCGGMGSGPLKGGRGVAFVIVRCECYVKYVGLFRLLWLGFGVLSVGKVQ